MRVGIIVPRYGRTAVARNRLKRRLRALSAQVGNTLTAGADTVIVVAPAAYDATYAQLGDAVQAAVAFAQRARGSRAAPATGTP